MPYLFTLPGLLCGLALSIEDVRCRRVPIAWVAVGALLQLAADFFFIMAVDGLGKRGITDQGTTDGAEDVGVELALFVLGHDQE